MGLPFTQEMSGTQAEEEIAEIIAKVYKIRSIGVEVVVGLGHM